MCNFDYHNVVLPLSTQAISITVEGMTCGHCKAAVERLLTNLNGVEAAVVDLQAGTVEVKANSEAIGRSQLIDSINNSEIYKAS